MQLPPPNTAIRDSLPFLRRGVDVSCRRFSSAKCGPPTPQASRHLLRIKPWGGGGRRLGGGARQNRRGGVTSIVKITAKGGGAGLRKNMVVYGKRGLWGYDSRGRRRAVYRGGGQGYFG